MKVDERIVGRLGELGMTQKALAAKVGVQPSCIAHICRGAQTGSVSLLRRIAAELQLDPDLLIVESGLMARSGSMRYKQAMATLHQRGWSLDEAGHLGRALS